MSILTDYYLSPIAIGFFVIYALSFALYTFFHLGWHFKYYARLLRNSRSKAREAEAAERFPAPRGTRGQVALIPERVHSLERR